MPTIYVTLWDTDDNEVMMPLPYKKVGSKYLYGPEANGKRRKPEVLKPSILRKVIDGYYDLFNMIRGK